MRMRVLSQQRRAALPAWSSLGLVVGPPLEVKDDALWPQLC